MECHLYLIHTAFETVTDNFLILEHELFPSSMDYSLEVLNDWKLNYSSKDRVYFNYKHKERSEYSLSYTWMYVTAPINCFQNVGSSNTSIGYCGCCCTPGWMADLTLETQPLLQCISSNRSSISRSAYMDGLGTDPPKGRKPPLETPQFNSLLWRGHTRKLTKAN